MPSMEMTRPGHDDPTLRGRRYAIPFDAVWAKVVDVVRKGSGWTLVEADDHRGIVRAEARRALFRSVDDVRVRVWLDADAQTRVDVLSRSRSGTTSPGRNARRIRRLLRDLDRALNPPPRAILPPEGGQPLAHGASR